MKQALLNHGWYQEDDLERDMIYFYKRIVSTRYSIGLKYNTANRLLTVTIRYRPNGYQRSTMITMEFLKYGYDALDFTIRSLMGTIKTLPTIVYDELDKI